MKNVTRNALLVMLLMILQLFFPRGILAQSDNKSGKKIPEQHYWNTDLQIVPYRLPPPPIGYKPEYIDLDGDGDPDILKSVTKNNTPVMWIDDDDDMRYGDNEGDTDSDCVLIDRNGDGKYGDLGDLIIDWVGTNSVGKADMQLIVDYPVIENEKVWPGGHYMWVLDTDHDNIFNYVDWNTLQLKSWQHSGTADFFPDYSGQSMFIKAHATPNRIENIKLNWENPFLFYDQDKDGLSEMAVRLIDLGTPFKDPNKKNNSETMRFSGKIDWASISVDLDNDNRPGNELDFDFTIGFRVGGFDYMDQVHKINMGSLPGTDIYFKDPDWRHLDELIYTNHENALNRIFKMGKWGKVYFVYDEDDDCNRWERVEFLDALDPFKIGTGKGGIDANSQSDIAGDRGEWDLDNSGKGKLYISKFDGRLHLFGAEWGCWRIDQEAGYYQGWDRSWLNRIPPKFATVKYLDTDSNGFLNKILYDLDGDAVFEDSIDLRVLGIADRCNLIDISSFKYKDYLGLKKKISDQMWTEAQIAIKVAAKYGVNVGWYAKLLQASSVREKYHKGYWIQFYIYRDLTDLYLRQNNRTMLGELNKAYYSGNWSSLLK